MEKSLSYSFLDLKTSNSYFIRKLYVKCTLNDSSQAISNETNFTNVLFFAKKLRERNSDKSAKRVKSMEALIISFFVLAFKNYVIFYKIFPVLALKNIYYVFIWQWKASRQLSSYIIAFFSAFSSQLVATAARSVVRAVSELLFRLRGLAVRGTFRFHQTSWRITIKYLMFSWR